MDFDSSSVFIIAGIYGAYFITWLLQVEYLHLLRSSRSTAAAYSIPGLTPYRTGGMVGQLTAGLGRIDRGFETVISYHTPDSRKVDWTRCLWYIAEPVWVAYQHCGCLSTYSMVTLRPGTEGFVGVAYCTCLAVTIGV